MLKAFHQRWLTDLRGTGPQPQLEAQKNQKRVYFIVNKRRQALGNVRAAKDAGDGLARAIRRRQVERYRWSEPCLIREPVQDTQCLAESREDASIAFYKFEE
ncbi:MAG: hypothetical protein WDM89_18470 [Rhizomicrobium sp.]